MKYTPTFESIMNKIRSIPESELNTPENRNLFLLAYHHAPPELREMFEQGMKEHGLIPKPTLVDDQGNAVFSIEELAAFYGTTVEEVKAELAEVEKILSRGSCNKYHGPVHRLH